MIKDIVTPDMILNKVTDTGANKIPSFTTGSVTISSVSRKELNRMLDQSIKIWHFERSSDGKGVVPVKGEFDPFNPNHIAGRFSARRGRR
jgi:hypothetical protein